MEAEGLRHQARFTTARPDAPHSIAATKPVTKAAKFEEIMTVKDDGESIALFEPLMISEGAPDRSKLNDLALELAARAAAFLLPLPKVIAGFLSLGREPINGGGGTEVVEYSMLKR
jgi:hypothetical protein